VEKKPLQVGGNLCGWRSPDGRFKRAFLKLDPGCDQFARPAVLILSDSSDEHAEVTSTENLANELPRLLAAWGQARHAYALHEPDEAKRTQILAELTDHPVFVG
jgi:hypothetical protein